MARLALLVFIGGGIGSTVRFLLHHACGKLWPSIFPLGTLLVNVLGSLLIGIFFVLFAKNIINYEIKTFLMVGICGGFTTFSAFSLESFQLYKQGETLYLAGYIILSVILCIFSVWLGNCIGRALFNAGV